MMMRRGLVCNVLYVLQGVKNATRATTREGSTAASTDVRPVYVTTARGRRTTRSHARTAIWSSTASTVLTITSWKRRLVEQFVRPSAHTYTGVWTASRPSIPGFEALTMIIVVTTVSATFAVHSS